VSVRCKRWRTGARPISHRTRSRSTATTAVEQRQTHNEDLMSTRPTNGAHAVRTKSNCNEPERTNGIHVVNDELGEKAWKAAIKKLPGA